MNHFMWKFNVFKHLPVFTGLSWFDLQKIARKTSIEDYKKGMFVSGEGNPPDFFYAVVSGRLQAYTFGRAGIKDNVDFIHKGMYFGIISLFTGENHSMNFETINDSVILKIPQDDFKEILKTIPHLAIVFSEVLSKRIRRKVKGTQIAFESEIISVYSPVTGTGCTTFSYNLSTSLKKETNKRVVLVRLLKQSGAVERTLESSSQKGYVALNELVGCFEKVQGHIAQDVSLQLDFLNVFIPALDRQNVAATERLTRNIAPLITSLVGDYHYVVVDLPTGMEDVVLETLIQSDQVYVLSSDKKPELALSRRVLDRLERSLKDRFKEDKIRVLIRPSEIKSYIHFEEIDRFLNYNVYTMLPAEVEDGFVPVDTASHQSFDQCRDYTDYHRVVTRLARSIGRVLVGLVLGGGAALGIAHIGVLKVLEREKVPIDIVIGSSMGALIGSMWVTGKDAKSLEEVGQEFKTVFKLHKLVDLVIPISGIIGGSGIKKWLRRHLGQRTFYGTKIPFKVVAYDLMRREEMIISHGSLVDAVRQSISIPGVLEPVKKGNQVIIDGGVLNPLPTNVLTGLGIKKIIAVNVLQSPSDVSTGLDAILERRAKKAARTFSKYPLQFIVFRVRRFMSSIFRPNISEIITMTIQASEYEIAKHSEEYADVNIHPDLSGVYWYEFYKVEDLIQRGEKATEECMTEIKTLLQRGRETSP